MQQKLLDELHLFGVPGDMNLHLLTYRWNYFFIPCLPGIRKVYLSEKKNVQKWSDEHGFQGTKEWIVETDGNETIITVELCVDFSDLSRFQLSRSNGLPTDRSYHYYIK